MQESMNDTLNDLVMINNDRIAGYEKAVTELNNLDIDLKAHFEDMIRQSEKNKADLVKVIDANAGIVEDDTTSAGKIYRAWMDIKATMTESDRHSVLASCEFGEDATLRAYDAALSSGAVINSQVQQQVQAQRDELQKAHDMIKQQREAHKALQHK